MIRWPGETCHGSKRPSSTPSAAPATPQRWMPHRWERCRRAAQLPRSRRPAARPLPRGGSARGRVAALAPRRRAESRGARRAAGDSDAVAVLCRVGGAKPERCAKPVKRTPGKAAATLLVCGADATGAAHVARRCGHVHLATAHRRGPRRPTHERRHLCGPTRQDGEPATRLPGMCGRAEPQGNRATRGSRRPAPPLLAGVLRRPAAPWTWPRRTSSSWRRRRRRPAPERRRCSAALHHWARRRPRAARHVLRRPLAAAAAVPGAGVTSAATSRCACRREGTRQTELLGRGPVQTASRMPPSHERAVKF